MVAQHTDGHFEHWRGYLAAVLSGADKSPLQGHYTITGGSQAQCEARPGGQEIHCENCRQAGAPGQVTMQVIYAKCLVIVEFYDEHFHQFAKRSEWYLWKIAASKPADHRSGYLHGGGVHSDSGSHLGGLHLCDLHRDFCDAGLPGVLLRSASSRLGG